MSDNNSETDSVSEWTMTYEFGPAQLREVDPVSVIMEHLTELKALRNDQQALFTILSELYNNALDHGILELNSDVKSTSEGFSDYFAAREKKLNDLEQGKISVYIKKISNTDGVTRLSIVVQDSGKGFDHNEVRNKILENNRPSGRGIYIVEQLCESVEYNETGNCVEAVFSTQTQ